MAFVNPSVQEFKDYFYRDFPYGTDVSTSVTDQDIAIAYQETNVNFNQALWAEQSSYTVGYLLLAAHYLVTNLLSSSQGISGQYNWLTTSKSVGSVSEAYQIPDRILEDPYFAMLSKTRYGARFLMLVLPQLTGMVFIAPGSTRP